MIRGIIFDLDGVIVHTDELHYQAWKKVADRIGVKFDKKMNDRLRGISRMDSLNIILENEPSISDTEKFLLADEKNDLYRQLLSTLTEKDVSCDVRDTLTELKKRRVKLAIGSSSKNAGVILHQIKLSGYFDAISDGNNILNAKPDPEVFLKAAEFLMLTPSECAVVEDAYAGIDAAIAGGFYSVGIGDAANHKMIDLKAGCLADVLRIVLEDKS